MVTFDRSRDKAVLQVLLQIAGFQILAVAPTYLDEGCGYDLYHLPAALLSH